MKIKSPYEAYLATALWKTIRARVLARDHTTCQACRKKATLVHHKSYDRDVLDGNRDESLVSLCKRCHKDIEFTMVDSTMVKNSLDEANHKLALKMAESQPDSTYASGRDGPR